MIMTYVTYRFAGLIRHFDLVYERRKPNGIFAIRISHAADEVSFVVFFFTQRHIGSALAALHN